MATANPNFELQQRALDSLQHIHVICLALEAMQILASFLVVSLGYFSTLQWLGPSLHLYAALLYLLTAVFAHVVVYYVLLAMGRNVRAAHHANPGQIEEWLVVASGKLQDRLLPFIVLHGMALLVLITFSGQTPAYGIAAWCAATVGGICLARVVYALRQNTEHLRSFVQPRMETQ